MEKEVSVEKSFPAALVAPNRYGYRGKYKPIAAVATQPHKFEGKYDSLKGFIFDCIEGMQSDRYNVMIKGMAKYVGREYVYGGDVRWTIKIRRYSQ
jgi:hypothetical protein